MKGKWRTFFSLVTNMFKQLVPFILLIISDILIFTVYNYISKKEKKTQLSHIFSFSVMCMMLWCSTLIIQILLINFTNISPIYVDYVVYVAICFLPVTLFFTSLILEKTKINFKQKYLLLLIIPVLSLIVLWTNDLHHLFYKTYSIYTSDTVFGPYFYIHTFYTFGLFAIAFVIMIKTSVKSSGFFSKQSALIILGALIPIIINIAGILGVPMTIYYTPISFSITILLFALAIFKLKFLSSTPIAIQKIVDRMSDGYLVLGEDQNIIDFNKTFLDIFHFSAEEIRNKNMFYAITPNHISTNNINKIKSYINDSKTSTKTNRFDIKLVNEERYFNVEINSILSEGNFIGTLILFKDTTQHMLDMQTIQNNQQLLMERERLASLGQLIGGIAHNLKTPIMSISGAAEGLTDLVKEYDSSIGDPEVTNDDHHDIAKDMREWIEKIKTYTAYMSDVITTVKGQAVTLSEEQVVSFDIDELVKRVDILMKHELKNALVVLNVQMNTSSSTTLHGNIVSLVQVINNMISNSIQAYNGVPNKEINFIVDRDGNNIVLSIQDFAGGLPKEVEEKLFKEMITTKGKNGTGLGLFMSYSTIRAHFNGNITFETEQGKGTTFHIIIPVE